MYVSIWNNIILFAANNANKIIVHWRTLGYTKVIIWLKSTWLKIEDHSILGYGIRVNWLYLSNFYPTTLKMEATNSFVTSVTNYTSTRRLIPEVCSRPLPRYHTLLKNSGSGIACEGSLASWANSARRQSDSEIPPSEKHLALCSIIKPALRRYTHAWHQLYA